MLDRCYSRRCIQYWGELLGDLTADIGLPIIIEIDNAQSLMLILMLNMKQLVLYKVVLVVSRDGAADITIRTCRTGKSGTVSADVRLRGCLLSKLPTFTSQATPLTSTTYYDSGSLASSFVIASISHGRRRVALGRFITGFAAGVAA